MAGGGRGPPGAVLDEGHQGSITGKGPPGPITGGGPIDTDVPPGKDRRMVDRLEVSSGAKGHDVGVIVDANGSEEDALHVLVLGACGGCAEDEIVVSIAQRPAERR